MQSSTFPWMSHLADEQAYEFLDEVIRCAKIAGTHTDFLRVLDERAAAWAVTAEAMSVVRQASNDLDP
ncbi:hypothetical protein ACFYRJ_22125 [Streptomyces sp. NPDC005531]|uniref:hypothetical protein n=1 Tax=Streptomyces sp. NPDC005531 TaxID=3364722 RepID=UPI003680FC15